MSNKWEKSLIKIFLKLKKKSWNPSYIDNSFLFCHCIHTPNHSLPLYTVKSPWSGKKTSFKDLKGFKKLTF